MGRRRQSVRQNMRKKDNITKSRVEEHKGERKRRKTNVFYVTAIICVPLKHVYSVLSTCAVACCVCRWNCKNNTDQSNWHVFTHSLNKLFTLVIFQFMSHPASTAVCPLWLQQICKQGIVLEMTGLHADFHTRSRWFRRCLEEKPSLRL